MRISHVAIWTKDLEKLKEFYCRYFGGRSNELYVNATKGFKSYFITFDGDTSLEIMSRTGIEEKSPAVYLGLCHIAFLLPDRESVINMTEKLGKDGYKIVGMPRVTGDGFFESVIGDPDGNLVELTAE